MKIPNLTYGEAINDELSFVCRLMLCSIIRKRLHDEQTINIEERYIIDAYDIIHNIHNCLETIDNAILFIKEGWDSEFGVKHRINEDTYLLYHYDIICHKIYTVRDLYFKLINHIYELGLKNKECKWKNIKGKRKSISNTFLFSLLNDNQNSLKSIYLVRTVSSHDGVIRDKSLDVTAINSILAIYKDLIPKNLINGITINNNLFYRHRFQENKSKFIEHIEICRYNTFIYTRCILCSLCNDFLSKISIETKRQHLTSKTTEEILKLKSKRNCINNKHPNDCPNSWKHSK